MKKHISRYLHIILNYCTPAFLTEEFLCQPTGFICIWPHQCPSRIYTILLLILWWFSSEDCLVTKLLYWLQKSWSDQRRQHNNFERVCQQYHWKQQKSLQLEPKRTTNRRKISPYFYSTFSRIPIRCLDLTLPYFHNVFFFLFGISFDIPI